MSIYLRKYPIIVMLGAYFFSRIILYVNSYFLCKINYQTWGMIPCRIMLSIFMIICMCLCIDKKVFCWSAKSCRYALIKSLIMLLYNGSVCFILLYWGITEKNIGNIVSNFFVCASLCFAISVFEECLYRGIITSGLQKILPQNKKGIYLTVFISGIFFGFIHVTSYFQDIKYSPFSVLFQIIISMIQLGSVGIIFSAIFLKTRNIWGCIIVHFIIDFLPFFPIEIINGSIYTYAGQVNVHTEYSLLTIIVEIICCVITAIPNILISLRIVKNIEVEKCGLWKKECINSDFMLKDKVGK